MFINLIGYGHAKTTLKWSHTVNKTPETHLSRIYYCLNDNAYYKINEELYPFKRNNLYIIPQNLPIKFFCTEGTDFEHIFFDFIINPQFQFSYVMEYDLNSYPVLKNSINFIISFFNENNIGDISKYRRHDTFREYKDIIEHYLYTLLIYLDKSAPLFVDTNSPIHKAILYIYSYYNTNITISSLCRIALCNENTFIKQFKNVTGKTPYQYIKDYRLSLSCSMLQANTPIKDVAEKVGFLSSSAFSNAFYKKYGIYPASYRKMFT